MRILGFNISRYTGRDQYSKTPFLQYFDPTYLLSGKTPQWVTVDNSEGFLYRTTAPLQKVINKKATLFSNGKFCHYRIGSNGKPERIENSELIDLLENPNPLQSRSEWLMEEMIHRCVWGNSFVHPLYGTKIDAYPGALWNLPPQFMIVNRTGLRWGQSKIKGIIDSYELQYVSGDSDTFDPEEVIHGRIINPEDAIVGLSPLYGIQRELSNIRASMGMRNVIMTENGALGFISREVDRDVIGPTALSEDQRVAIEKQFSQTHGQFDGQARVRMINHAAKWNPMTFPMDKMELLEGETKDVMALIDAYQMNTNVFSSEKGSTFANAQEGKKSAYQDAVIPYANDFCFNLNKGLKLTEKGEYIDLDYSHIECLQQDQGEKAKTMKTKAEAYKILMETGNFESDEVREMLDLEIPED